MDADSVKEHKNMQAQPHEIEIYNRADLYEVLDGDGRKDIDFYLLDS